MNGIKSAGRGEISCLFGRAADNRAAAKFPLYHIPQILSSKIYKKITQIFIPKFVQNFHLTKVPGICYNGISRRSNWSRRDQKGRGFLPRPQTFNTIHLMQFQQSLLRCFSKSVCLLHRATTGKYHGLGHLQTDIYETVHS